MEWLQQKSQAGLLIGSHLRAFSGRGRRAKPRGGRRDLGEVAVEQGSGTWWRQPASILRENSDLYVPRLGRTVPPLQVGTPAQTCQGQVQLGGAWLSAAAPPEMIIMHPTQRSLLRFGFSTAGGVGGGTPNPEKANADSQGARCILDHTRGDCRKSVGSLSETRHVGPAPWRAGRPCCGCLLTAAGPRRRVLPRTDPKEHLLPPGTPSCHCGRTVLAPGAPGTASGPRRPPPHRAGAAAALPCGADGPWGGRQAPGKPRPPPAEGSGRRGPGHCPRREPTPAGPGHPVCPTSSRASQPRSQSKGGLALPAYPPWRPKPHRRVRQEKQKERTGSRPRSA